MTGTLKRASARTFAVAIIIAALFSALAVSQAEAALRHFDGTVLSKNSANHTFRIKKENGNRVRFHVNRARSSSASPEASAACTVACGQGFALGVLAMLGLAGAAALGLLANAVAGDSIGLSAAPLHAGRNLAPAQARRSPSDDHGGPRAERHGGRAAGVATTIPGTGSPTEHGDDHASGGGGGPGSTIDNSGPGSLSSGSGDISGSSGSDSGGSDD